MSREPSTAFDDLLDACLTVKAYLDKLEEGHEDDVLSQMRRRYHKPLRDKLEPAIARAQKAQGERLFPACNICAGPKDACDCMPEVRA